MLISGPESVLVVEGRCFFTLLCLFVCACRRCGRMGSRVFIICRLPKANSKEREFGRMTIGKVKKGTCMYVGSRCSVWYTNLVASPTRARKKRPLARSLLSVQGAAATEASIKKGQKREILKSQPHRAITGVFLSRRFRTRRLVPLLSLPLFPLFFFDHKPLPCIRLARSSHVLHSIPSSLFFSARAPLLHRLPYARPARQHTTKKTLALSSRPTRHAAANASLDHQSHAAANYVDTYAGRY